MPIELGVAGTIPCSARAPPITHPFLVLAVPIGVGPPLFVF